MTVSFIHFDHLQAFLSVHMTEATMCRLKNFWLWCPSVVLKNTHSCHISSQIKVLLTLVCFHPSAVRLAVSAVIGVVGGVLLVMSWWRFGSVMACIIVVGLMLGFLIASTILFTPLGMKKCCAVPKQNTSQKSAFLLFFNTVKMSVMVKKCPN